MREKFFSMKSLKINRVTPQTRDNSIFDKYDGYAYLDLYFGKNQSFEFI